jgi:predicted lipoprotein
VNGAGATGGAFVDARDALATVRVGAAAAREKAPERHVIDWWDRRVASVAGRAAGARDAAAAAKVVIARAAETRSRACLTRGVVVAVRTPSSAVPRMKS